jgi:Concanavalin A-like lectin/glucanases superfamily
MEAVQPSWGALVADLPLVRLHPLYHGCVWHSTMAEGGGSRLLNVAAPAGVGTFVGTPTWVQGPSTWAVRFSATNYVSIPHNTSLDITGDFTFACWARRTSSTSAGILFAKTDGTGGWDYEWGIESTNGDLWVWADAFGGTVYRSTVVTLDTSWHHHAITRRGSAIQFWKDGQSAGTATSSVPFAANALPLTLGTDGNGSSTFRDDIADIRLYNRGLSPAEVASFFYAPWALWSLAAAVRRRPFRLLLSVPPRPSRQRGVAVRRAAHY